MSAGGNAVDGAVATAFALAVTCPRAGNIGGGGFAIIRTPQGDIVANDHREKAPGAAHQNMFLDAAGKPVPALSRTSYLAVGVPGTVAGLLDMLERYGRMSREQVLSPAIRLAKKGFRLSRHLAAQLEYWQPDFAKHPASRAIFINKGVAWQPGDLLRQTDLADTLMRIRRYGAPGFYQGKTADLLVAAMRSGGGLITHDDLRAYRSVWREPVRGAYRGYEIYSMSPPSSGGILLVQMLNMLEQVPVSTLNFGSANLLHYMIEAQRRAFAGRVLADPDFYRIPVQRITGKPFAKMRFADVDPERASRSADISQTQAPVRVAESTETTHISVLDAEGWAVALTTTLNTSYGTRIVAAGTGVLLNNEMDDFAAGLASVNLYGLTGREPNLIEPNKRMLSSMSPTLVLKAGEPFLITGAAGGPAIINVALQIIMNVIDHGMNLQQATVAPRIHHQWQPDIIRAEPFALSPDTLKLLQQKGHKKFVFRQPNAYSGGIGVANSIIQVEGTMQGVADPRRQGAASGF